MASVNSKIELFNLHVKENTQGLNARGECTENLMLNLFKFHMVKSDKDFVFYIKSKKNKCDEGKGVSED